MTDLSPETVGKPSCVPVHKRPAWLSSEDVQEAIRKLADTGSDKAVCWDMMHAVYKLTEAAHRDGRAMVAELPEPVDPDLVEVRQMVADAVKGSWPAKEIEQLLDGSRDDSPSIRVPLACIKRGRALAGGDRS